MVEIEYQDRVAYADGRFSLRFPMVVTPRYTPPGAAPLAEGPSPRVHRAAAAGGRDRDLFGPVRHPDKGPGNPVTLAVTLDPGLPLDSLESLYHPVAIAELDPRRRRITLAEGRVPAERDFVLEWRPKLGAAPEAAVFAEEWDGETYLTVLVVPPETDTEEVPEIPRDLIFVIDTSGSMHGPSIAQAAEALEHALARLSPDDRFNVIRFASGTDSLFRNVQPANPRNLRAAMAYLRALRAEGGTNMLPALLRALGGRVDPARLRQVVFLTDGAVGNEAELFEAIAGLLGEVAPVIAALDHAGHPGAMNSRLRFSLMDHGSQGDRSSGGWRPFFAQASSHASSQRSTSMPFIESVPATEYTIAVNLAPSSLFEPKLNRLPMTGPRSTRSARLLSIGTWGRSTKTLSPSRWLRSERSALPSRASSGRAANSRWASANRASSASFSAVCVASNAGAGRLTAR